MHTVVIYTIKYSITKYSTASPPFGKISITAHDLKAAKYNKALL